MPADPLAEALALLTAWLDGDDSCATLQRARAWVDARRAAATLDRATFERLINEGQQLRRQYERDSAPMRTRGAGDPPPSADYIGPGWADGVPRG